MAQAPRMEDTKRLTYMQEWEVAQYLVRNDPETTCDDPTTGSPGNTPPVVTRESYKKKCLSGC